MDDGDDRFGTRQRFEIQHLTNRQKILSSKREMIDAHHLRHRSSCAAVVQVSSLAFLSWASKKERIRRAQL